MTEQRRLAAIVSADVAGYSRLMGRDESGTLAALKAVRQEVVEPAITRHGGRIVKTTGDGLLLEFQSVVNAVRCAIEVQTAIADRSGGIAEDRRINFRVGINLGDIIVDGDDIFGDGVNVAARLQEIAPPGGICISSRVHDDVRDRLDTEFDDGGTQSLKNIARPVQVWLLRPGRAIPLKAAPAPTTLTLPDKPSIAVLPFLNMSGDPEQEYFTDGVTEDIITELSRFHSLFVIARNSSFSYKGKSLNIQQVGRDLGVRYLLDGSMRKSSNRIRVTGQLVDTLTGNQIWSERYDRVPEDVFAVQEELTQAVVAAIAPQIELTEQLRAARKRPENLSAYEIALRAYAHAAEGRDKTDRGIADLAIREAKEALAIDPSSVPALHAICIAHSNALHGQLVVDREHALREAASAAARAIELDGANALSYAQRGIIVLLSGQLDRYPEALMDARRAHELNPNDTFVLRLLGTLEAAVGQHEQALEHGQQVLRLNPRQSRNHMAYNLMAYASFGAKKYREGVEWASRALNHMPSYAPAYIHYVVCLVGSGDVAKARVAFDSGKALAPEYFRSRLDSASSYAREEDSKRATTFLRISAGLEDPSAAEALR
ncbi:adenylate/guanylate cyclase domain-containing protein [Reyranella soli]|uniref:Guanylyl cyclase n=1 Tax=Reyranella soli TaxID=1230389 RepID=A0A512NLQ7_9HYPH|nr:adenylate/guanylate cyclase domain-containing protein [Reyranella soli]GEP59881.1 guanylyl cyclase [Reyranella soli]